MLMSSLTFLNIWTSVSIMTLSIKLMLKTLLLGVVLTSRRTIHHHDGHHIVWWWILATMYVYPVISLLCCPYLGKMSSAKKDQNLLLYLTIKNLYLPLDRQGKEMLRVNY